jgi:hypothetical protein
MCTGILILILCQLHPPTSVNASLRVKEISFSTDSPAIFSSENLNQFVISGVSSVILQGTGIKLDKDSQPQFDNQLTLRGNPVGSCTFYNVRISPIHFIGNPVLTLLWPKNAGDLTFAMKSHGVIRGTITAQPSAKLKSGFVCARMSAKEEQTVTVEGEFSDQDSIDFVTANDVQLNFRGTGDSDFEDTQIAVLDDMRFSHVEIQQAQGEGVQRRQEEKTVLLPPAPGQSNELLFETVNKNVKVNDADLLTIRTDSDFYIRKFSVNRGIQLSLHGVVKDVSVGAGLRDLKSQMPSLFEELDGQKRTFTVIPGIVALILGLLEKLGVLPGREKN